ncbi:MAG TPA: hypothetical protein VK559_04345 [Ferruginibacter sp.]|nr:hypothetical protein [Ferruginibacter sp.]
MPDSSKVEIISKALDTLASKPVEKVSMWVTLIPLLIGAALTLIIQLLIEIYKSSKLRESKRQVLISKAKAKTYLIAQTLKDLAMYKVHKQYYIRSFQITKDPIEKEDSFKKQYEKGQEQRSTEMKLDDNIAEYFQIITEYIIVTKNKKNFQQFFDTIFHYQYPKSSKFDNCHTSEELIAELDIQERSLNEKYKVFLNSFESIQSLMS